MFKIELSLTHNVPPVHAHFFYFCTKLLFSHDKSINVNPFEHVHLPFSHTPELLLPVHCSCELQNPPTGTVSEMINQNNINAK